MAPSSCFDARTGDKVWEQRLKGPGSKNSTWSSMLVADGKIYIPNQSGDVFVLRAGPKFELLATNSVNEPTNASLAVIRRRPVLPHGQGPLVPRQREVRVFDVNGQALAPGLEGGQIEFERLHPCETVQRSVAASSRASKRRPVPWAKAGRSGSWTFPAHYSIP